MPSPLKNSMIHLKEIRIYRPQIRLFDIKSILSRRQLEAVDAEKAVPFLPKGRKHIPSHWSQTPINPERHQRTL